MPKISDIEETPNPNAVKFILREPVSNGTARSYSSTDQAQDAIAEEAQRCNGFYLNQRWLGGLLTNWVTVQKSVKRLKELDDMATDGRYELLPKKEVIKLERERKHLEANLAGIKNMNRLPDAVFVIDSNKEQIAVREARKLGIPVVAVVDTNCDPTEVDYVIPGNDDALRAIRLFTSKISDSAAEGVQMIDDKQIAEMQAAAQAADAASQAPAAGITDDGSGDDISMEDVLGAGTRRKEVASEENVGEVPEVETQAY